MSDIDYEVSAAIEGVTPLNLPTSKLLALRQSWESHGSDTEIIDRVRDLFNGQDGHLQVLDLAFHEHQWTAWSYVTNPAGSRHCEYVGCYAVQHD